MAGSQFCIKGAKMKQLTSLIILSLLFAANPLPANGQSANASSVSNISIDSVQFVPCANGGAGELVALHYTIKLVFHASDDPSGGVHVTIELNSQGGGGVGLTTGDSYHQVQTGMTHIVTTITEVAESTFVATFRLVGQGNRNDLVWHSSTHLTINSNGEVTSSFLYFSGDCH
jgi:hypothetical protein